MAEGDPHLQEQISAQEQGTVLFLIEITGGIYQSISQRMCELCIWFLIIAGVCHNGQWDSHLPASADKAGGESVHVPVESRHGGSAGGHVMFPPPL